MGMLAKLSLVILAVAIVLGPAVGVMAHEYPEIKGCALLGDSGPRWIKEQPVEFRDCYERFAKNYERIYNEGKDLAKSFLTLISAVFVASLTFSEKIINWHSLSKWPKRYMIACWLALLAALVLCGTGLVLFLLGLGRDYPAVVSYSHPGYYAAIKDGSLFFTIGGVYGFASGGLFVLGLVLMLLAGYTATRHEAIHSEGSSVNITEVEGEHLTSPKSVS